MAKLIRFYHKSNCVYDREWFPRISKDPPPPFLLARCRNAKVAKILAQTLNGEWSTQILRNEAAMAQPFEE